jgi:hypothetical protein
MKIYVAGEVPRDEPWMASEIAAFGLPKGPPTEALLKTYRQIEESASNASRLIRRSIELKMPYTDAELDGLEPKAFVKYLRNEISRSDAVLTVFFPPGIAAACEAHLASELRKPQIILAPRSLRVPRYLHTLNRLVNIHVLEDVEMADVLIELTKAVHESAQEFEYPSYQ